MADAQALKFLAKTVVAEGITEHEPVLPSINVNLSES
jgi:hypothetical protein